MTPEELRQRARKAIWQCKYPEGMADVRANVDDLLEAIAPIYEAEIKRLQDLMVIRLREQSAEYERRAQLADPYRGGDDIGV